MDLADLAALADRLEHTRQKRLEASRIVSGLEADENALKDQLVREMEAQSLSSIGGKTVIIERSVKLKPIVTDWAMVQAFVKEHDAFDLYQKRLTPSAVTLREDDGIHVPGVTQVEYSHLSFKKPRI